MLPELRCTCSHSGGYTVCVRGWEERGAGFVAFGQQQTWGGGCGGTNGGSSFYHKPIERDRIIELGVSLQPDGVTFFKKSLEGIISCWVSPLDITAHTHGHTAQSQNLERKNTHIYPSWPVMARGANAIQRLVYEAHCSYIQLWMCRSDSIESILAVLIATLKKKSLYVKIVKLLSLPSRSSHPFQHPWPPAQWKKTHGNPLILLTSTTAQTDTEHSDNDAHQSPVSLIRTCTKCPAETDFTAMTAGESRLVPESWAYTFKVAVQTTCRATQWYREKTNRGRGFRWLLVYLFFLFNISKSHNHLTGIQAPAATSFQCNIALLCAELVVKVNCVTSLHNLPSEPQNLKKIKIKITQSEQHKHLFECANVPKKYIKPLNLYVDVSKMRKRDE